MSVPNTVPDALRKLLTPTLTTASSGLELRRGEPLFLQRQRPRYMYFVVGGEIVLERTGEGGDPVVLQRVRQGFVAEASLQSGSYHCDAVVTSPGAAIAVPIEPLKAELATDPAFALRWIGMLNAEVRRLRAQCERMSLKGVGERLLHMVETEGVHGRLPIGSGLKSLATELAVSHEALYRTVAALEKSGVIVRESGSLILVRTSGHASRPS
ncbi:Crp/Fnr family transcriptional regulator [Variovorax boronicumulans]|uniref:Crp/Fnr family transcriptional regulator n=1 Tax=Variovorax boronicumulans TaxID=436515 RepID=UPI00339B68DC